MDLPEKLQLAFPKGPPVKVWSDRFETHPEITMAVALILATSKSIGIDLTKG